MLNIKILLGKRKENWKKNKWITKRIKYDKTFKKTIYYNELIGYSWKKFPSLICNKYKINCHEYCNCFGCVFIGRWGCGRIKDDYCTYCDCHYAHHSRGDYHYVERSNNSNEKISKSKEIGQNEEKLNQLKKDTDTKLKIMNDEIEKTKNELKLCENK